MLERTLSKHLENTTDKIKTRINILQKLYGITWGARVDMLRISSLALVFSTTE